MEKKDIWEKHSTIAHYSDICSIMSILKSKQLHASRFDYLEDPTEIVYAKEILVRVIYDEYKKIDNNSTHKDVRHKLDKIAYPALGNNIFILSFSQINNDLQTTESENDGSLSMWRYYAKDDGCYIEFHAKALDESILKNTVFDKVIYDAKHNDSQTLAHQFAVELKKQDAGEQSDILSPFFELASRSKHPAFKDEREIRLAVLNEMPVIDRVFPVHAKPCSKIYIEFPFEPKAVRKIVIGPSKDQDGIYKQVENCLKI